MEMGSRVGNMYFNAMGKKLESFDQLTDTTRTVDDYVIKSLILWAKGIVISQVPLTNHPSRITRFLQIFRQRFVLIRQHVAAHNRVPYASAQAVLPTHDCSTGR